MQKLQRISVGDGISLSIAETDKFKTGHLSVQFLMPLGFADCACGALLTAVLRRTSLRYPRALDLARALEELYGASVSRVVRKKGEYQVLGLSIDFLAERYTLGGEKQLAAAADLLFEFLLRPAVRDGAFDSAIVEQEKKNLCDLIDGRINDKRSYAITRCVELMCDGEKYGLDELGTRGEVEAITPESLYAYYQRLIRETPIEIFFVGEGSEDLAGLVRGKCAALPRGGMRQGGTEVRRTAGEVRRFTDEMPVAQGKLTLGFRTGITAADPDYPALVLFNAIYGATPNGKLFDNVREKLSLCYYCSTMVERAKGLLLVYSGIEVKDKQQAEDEILRQLEAMRAGDFSDADMAEAVATIQNSYRSAEDSAAAVEDWYLTGLIAGNTADFAAMSERVAAVTREQVVAAANKLTLDTIYFLRGTER